MIKLVDFWDDEPLVTSYLFKHPNVVDQHYFWATWNAVLGKAKKDNTAYSVADLNKQLQSKKLTFKLTGSTSDDFPWLNAMP
jgi:hypothetical protein